MNLVKLLVLFSVCLITSEHIGRVNDIPVIKPTTYIDGLTYGVGRVWYYAGYACASFSSKIYNIWANLWDYLEDVGITLKVIGVSCLDLLKTPKEFIVGFYERAKEFVYKYLWVFLIIFNLLVGLIGYYFRKQVLALNEYLFREMKLDKEQEHNPFAMLLLLYVILQLLSINFFNK